MPNSLCTHTPACNYLSCPNRDETGTPNSLEYPSYLPLEADEVTCPHCKQTQSDFTNGGDPGPWWNGQDDRFELKCDNPLCAKDFILETSWSPSFSMYQEDDE